ncbi:MAG: XdhC family protein [Woeseia sp.]|nr:XdhC family protein [Woeseia sp.]NNE60520.1 XdhC family protein [Woeseia sp.]
MNSRQLLSVFDERRDQQRDLVLATVYETAGSTYSKSGAQMLIDDEGNFQGMLSGGCLEGDLAERAATVLTSGEAQAISFNLGGSDDDLWGLGVGCDGVMRIFLQRLNKANDYEPFAAAADILRGDLPGALATIIQSKHAAIRPGAALALLSGESRGVDIPAPLAEVLHQPLQRALEKKQTSLRQLEWQGDKIDVLFAYLPPPPRVLVLGGGLDAQPLVRLIAELGWRVTVQDHRKAYIANGDFRTAEHVCCFPADELASALDLNRFSAAIVMSHHLVTDRSYLAALAGTGIPYIGLLGPPARRARLLDDLQDNKKALENRLHGPAGLDIGGRGPASIAVSIVAEMHRELTADGAA